MDDGNVTNSLLSAMGDWHDNILRKNEITWAQWTICSCVSLLKIKYRITNLTPSGDKSSCLKQIYYPTWNVLSLRNSSLIEDKPVVPYEDLRVSPPYLGRRIEIQVLNISEAQNFVSTRNTWFRKAKSATRTRFSLLSKISSGLLAFC